MLRREIGESAIIVVWLLATVFVWALGVMKNSIDGQKQHGGGGAVVPRIGRAGNGIIPNSFRAISSYLRIVSSGASTVARSAASVAASIVDRIDDANHDQVLWAGFDKLEYDGGITRQILLLGYRSGFQIWDVEEANNVRDLVSRHDNPVSFMQILPKPITSKFSEDKFADSRPLLVICADVSSGGGCNIQDGLTGHGNENIQKDQNYHESNGSCLPTVVRFYSLRTNSYVHVLKFRSIIYSIRCSPRIVAISQAAQIHCFDSATLERAYNILTNPIVTSCPGSGSMGYGPLAVGPRWLAYSGSLVAVSNSCRVNPEHLTPSSSFPGYASNGSLVAHYAKESSKQLATGIVTLGDIGYQKLAELLHNSRGPQRSGGPGWKTNGLLNGHHPDSDSVGMVIVRDIVSKKVISQFKAHTRPISALCFDPSGTLLVTASVQGHNINVFRITKGLPAGYSGSDTDASYVHIYRLQRGFTNAVIQDISFSNDSNWIMISSSRGTSHLFAINPFGGSVHFSSADASSTNKNTESSVMTKPAVRWVPNLDVQMPHQQSLCASGPPVTLSVISRIRNDSNGWKGTVSGTAAAATGRTISLSAATASSFHKCKGNSGFHSNNSNNDSFKTKYHLLVFSPSGSMTQYALRTVSSLDSGNMVSVSNDSAAPECEGRLVVEPIHKWNICQKQNRREREDNVDIYGEPGNSDSHKIYPEGSKKVNSVYPEVNGRISTEENHQLYISEAELQMHQDRAPLWAKHEVYFQSMMMDGTKPDAEDSRGGEIEIEKIPTCGIEERSKRVFSVFDYLQPLKFQQFRVASVDSDTNGQPSYPNSVPSESNRISQRSSSASIDSMNSSKETVNISAKMETESQPKFVNNNDDDGLTGNLFENGDEFD